MLGELPAFKSYLWGERESLVAKAARLLARAESIDVACRVSFG